MLASIKHREIVPLSELRFFDAQNLARVTVRGFLYSKHMQRNDRTVRFRCNAPKCRASLMVHAHHCVLNECHNHGQMQPVHYLLRLEARKLSRYDCFSSTLQAYKYACNQVSRVLGNEAVSMYAHYHHFFASYMRNMHKTPQAIDFTRSLPTESVSSFASSSSSGRSSSSSSSSSSSVSPSSSLSFSIERILHPNFPHRSSSPSSPSSSSLSSSFAFTRSTS